MRKLLVIPVSVIWVLFAQNDGLVKTFYESKALKTEGNYSNGVRNGLWTFWYEGELFEDFGEDRLPNTGDAGENNGIWDTTGTDEKVILDFDGDSIYDPPLKKMEGSYLSGDKEGTWTKWFANGNRKEESNFKTGKLSGSITKWYESGTKAEEGNYDNGKQNGKWTWYWESGIKKEITTFIDGQQEGLWITWYKDGSKKSERKFSSGERVR